MRLIVLALLVAMAAPAHAIFFFGGYIKTESSVTAGVDQRTREWINSLPETTRKEVIKALEEALPLLDKSVNAYLDRVDQIINERMVQLECTLGATFDNATDRLSSKFTGEMPRPVKHLETDWQGLDRSFKKDTTPHEVATAYSDFLTRATRAGCQVASTPEARERVDAIAMLARSKYRTWKAVEDKCSSSAACVKQRISEVKALLAKSDKRDLQVSDASAMVAAIKAPTASFFRGFDFASYEMALMRLHEAERELTVARLLREDSAKAHLAKAAAMYAAADQARTAGKLAISEVDLGSNANAINLAKAAVAEKEQISAELDAALAESSRFKTDVDRIRAGLAGVVAEAPGIEQAATIRYQRIAAAQKKAAEEREALQRSLQRMRDQMPT